MRASSSSMLENGSRRGIRHSREVQETMRCKHYWPPNTACTAHHPCACVQVQWEDGTVSVHSSVNVCLSPHPCRFTR